MFVQTMKKYNKITITAVQLDMLEENGYSEQQIADRLCCTRMGLYKYRKRIGCPQKIRQGDGLSKYTPLEKIHMQRKYTKDYYKRLKEDVEKFKEDLLDLLIRTNTKTLHISMIRSNRTGNPKTY